MHAVDPDVLREALNTLDLCSSAREDAKRLLRTKVVLLTPLTDMRRRAP